MAYSTLEVLLVDEFAPGTSILLSGPPLTRKHERLVRVLGGDVTDEGSLVVTTKMGAGKLLGFTSRAGRSKAPGPSGSSSSTRRRLANSTC
jgi:hypothetical protein